jgi:hypothetical protein
MRKNAGITFFVKQNLELHAFIIAFGGEQFTTSQESRTRQWKDTSSSKFHTKGYSMDYGVADLSVGY